MGILKLQHAILHKILSCKNFLNISFISEFIFTESFTAKRLVEEPKQLPCYHITTCAQNPFPIQHIGNLI